MKLLNKFLGFALAAITTVLLLSTCAFADRGQVGQQVNLTEDRAYDLGIQAYVYAYPLVLMEMTKRRQTYEAAPINEFFHVQAFPTPEMRGVVRPNADTLYSTAWLDLSREPVILSVPDTKGRYYLIQLLDAWTDTFAVPGKRTTGTQAGRFAIIGPNWKGTLPKGVRRIKAPTNMIWVLGRTQTNGIGDYANVHQIQRGFKLTLLSEWGKPAISPSLRPADSPTDLNTTPPQQVASMNAATFFKTFAELLKSNPPHAADAPLLSQLKAIGIKVGKDFDSSRLGPDALRGLERAAHDAPYQIMASLPINFTINNGWGFLVKVGRYGTAYMNRAYVALLALGALEPEDAVYGGARFDNEGRTLNGNNRYVLHFDKNAMPPVQAFWSVTLYAPDGFFAGNLINRYTIGDRDKLAFNQDGSLDVYIQHDRPDAGKESNWLPTPEGEFSLSMRLYWPKQEVTDGSWAPPAVSRVN